MSIDNRLLFMGTIEYLNSQEVGRRMQYEVAGQKISREYRYRKVELYNRVTGNAILKQGYSLEAAIRNFKKILASKEYEGVVEFSCVWTDKSMRLKGIPIKKR